LALAVKLSLGRLSKSTEAHLLVGSELAAIVGAVAGVVAVLVAVWPRTETRALRPRLVSPHLVPDEELVDRAEDMKGLVEQLEVAHVVVNCHGQRGSGKSFLLEHLTDVVNGYRALPPEHPAPQQVATALYFDLADAVGFREIEAQVSQATFAHRDGDWADFIGYVELEFARHHVLLVLDNMNTPGLWPSLGKAAHEYLAHRPDDRLVFGSIEPVTLLNLKVKHVELVGLDAEATQRLVAVRGGRLTPSEVDELHAEYEGLPIYTCLAAARTASSPTDQAAHDVDHILDRPFLEGLAPATRRLLAYSALLALVARQVPLARLEACPLARLDAELAVAKRFSLMTSLPDGDRRLVRMHDIVRDAVLLALTSDVSDAADFLFGRACGTEDMVDAALFAMFADPEGIGPAQFDRILGPVIESAVRSRNHALLTTLHDRAGQNQRTLEFISRDQSRVDLFAYGRASELAGLGQYVSAEEALTPTSIVQLRATRAMRSALQGKLMFLQADIAHLRNRYSEAADMFADLGEWARSAGDVSLQARCTWGHGHVLRHQGRELAQALSLLESAVVLADRSGELFAKAYAIANGSGVRLLLETVRDDEDERLCDLEAEIATSSAHDGYLLEVWKSRAQLAWWRGDSESALNLVEAAIERALALNDRLLYNLYFERAEYERFRGEYTSAVEDYRRVLEFGAGNRDRNLITNAVLGVVLLELSAGQWLHHDTRERARAAVLRARETAIEADIQLTVRIAETVTSLLDGSTAKPEAIRLLVL
jgi:tetratricopeptide (TPR) repeat protein